MLDGRSGLYDTFGCSWSNFCDGRLRVGDFALVYSLEFADEEEGQESDRIFHESWNFVSP